MSGRVLVVDDDAAMCAMLAAGLGKRGFTVTTLTDPGAAFEHLLRADIDVVVTDLNMRGMSGLELCTRIVDNRPDVAVVMITAFGSMGTAIAAIRAGAYDFITKPVELETLRLALDRAVRHRALTAEVRRLRQEVADARGLEDMIGSSPQLGAVRDLVTRVAETDATVLVTGERGTGKELVARAIHRRSRRSDGPFVVTSCAAIPEDLLADELFGDAGTPRAGRFAQAGGGTLFLDDIDELPLGLQPRLLRALEERVASSARVIAASNADLEALIDERRFREDLHARLDVVHLTMPPLRARSGDVLLLAQHFVAKVAAQCGKKVSGISPAAAEKLVAYTWPGNVRELGNCIERAVALTHFEDLTVEDLPDKVRVYSPQHVVVVAEDPDQLVPMAEVERRYILKVLEAHGGSRTLAARTLGFDRKTLYRKLKTYGLE